MNGTLVFSSRVLNKIRTLPSEEALAIATAIARDIILGQDSGYVSPATPVASIIYPLIRLDIEKDSTRFEAAV